MAVILTRQQLFERVWTEPIQTLSREFGLSDVGLAKLCRRHEIPVPPRGHWAKRRAGKRTSRPLLPALTGQMTARNIRLPGPRTDDPEPAPARPADPPHPLVAAETEPPNHIDAPAEGLHVTHPLLRSTRDYWTAIRRPYENWPTLLPRHFQIKISRELERRTLRLLQALFTALERRGHAVAIGDRGEIQVRVLDEVCTVHVRERQRQVRALQRLNRDPDLYSDKRPHDLIFTGELELRIGQRYRHEVFVGDNKTRLVEEQLNDVVIGLINTALAEKEFRAAQERARLAEIERAKERERLLERERVAAARVTRLEQLAEAAERHRRLVVFRNELREVVGEQRGGELGQWLSWIDSYVDGTDPLKAFRLSRQEITLYHCVSTYEVSAILNGGFKNETPAHGQDLPACVTFTDVPMRGIYGGTRCVEITAVGQDVLPYVSGTAGKPYKEFSLPEEIANRFPRRSGPA